MRGPVCLFLFLLALLAGSAMAQGGGDPPGRVGRLADVQGIVWLFDAQKGDWVAAERNRPLTSGDRLSTDPDARAELRVGSTVLRLAAGSELELLQLDDQRMRFQLHFGSLALRVRSRELAAEIEVLTAEGRVLPERAGHYRIDRRDDESLAGVWSGDLRLELGNFVVPLGAGQRARFWLEGRERSARSSVEPMPDDAFAAWALGADQRETRSAAQQYVSPEMTGVEDLERYGRWDSDPEYGPIWVPTVVAAGWVPYRDGRWVWVQPWGWTWVDAAPWGFAPFHYGRWVSRGGRWGWAPGPYVPRPVYAPALVGWVGPPRSGGSVSIGIGALPGSAWVPLAPREAYRPHYRASPIYLERLNGRQPPGGRPTPGAPFVHADVPGAVTSAPIHLQPPPGGARPPQGAPALRPEPPPARDGASVPGRDERHDRVREPGREPERDPRREAGQEGRPRPSAPPVSPPAVAPAPRPPAAPPAAAPAPRQPAPAPALPVSPAPAAHPPGPQPTVTIPPGGTPPVLPPSAKPAPPPAPTVAVPSEAPAKRERSPEVKGQAPEQRPGGRERQQAP